MDLGIMQPYFLPYLGYFQLFNHVDRFVIYDNIQFTKKGWIQRNRVLANGEPSYIGLPLKKASDYANIDERELAGTWGKERGKLVAKVSQNYRKAPSFESTISLFERIVNHPSTNLFDFLANSLSVVAEHLSITTPVLASSSFTGNQLLQAEERVIDLCQRMEAKRYVNPIGGTELYSHTRFAEQGLHLAFLEYQVRPYPQASEGFYSHLSILDVLMWNDLALVKKMLKHDFSLLGAADVSLD